jgi:hypothetical protein
MPGIETRSDTSPARADEVVLGQAVPPGLLETERPACKVDRNARSSCHSEGSCAPGSRNRTLPVNAPMTVLKSRYHASSKAYGADSRRREPIRL